MEEKARVAVVAALVPFRGASRTLSRAMGRRESRTGAEVRASNGWEWVAGGPAKGLRCGGGDGAGSESEGLGDEAGDGGRKGGNAARQQERGEREEG